jgi:hypothetical protein
VDDDEPTFRIDVNAGDQLFQTNIEIIRDRARDMTLEKDGEAYASDGQRSDIVECLSQQQSAGCRLDSRARRYPSP